MYQKACNNNHDLADMVTTDICESCQLL